MSQSRRPCAGLWNTPMVHLNGDLTTCCLDLALENRLGNLVSESLQSLWQGPTIHRWRLAQIRGEFENSGPCCTHCNFESAGAATDEHIKAYLEKTGETAALEAFLRSRESASGTCHRGQAIPGKSTLARGSTEE